MSKIIWTKKKKEKIEVVENGKRVEEVVEEDTWENREVIEKEEGKQTEVEEGKGKNIVVVEEEWGKK